MADVIGAAAESGAIDAASSPPLNPPHPTLTLTPTPTPNPDLTPTLPDPNPNPNPNQGAIDGGHGGAPRQHTCRERPGPP